jgi:hypothetical protein
MIRISYRLAMAAFDSYKGNGLLTTYKLLPRTNIIDKFWTTNLAFTYEGNGVYVVDIKKKAENRSVLLLFEAWVRTKYPYEVL